MLLAGACGCVCGRSDQDRRPGPSRDVCPHSSGVWRPEIGVPVALVSPGASLLGVLVAFPPRTHPLCLVCVQVSSSL